MSFLFLFFFPRSTGIAQSFVDTHTQQPQDNSQSSLPLDMQQTPDFCCPCGGFLGWKQIRLGGKSLSKSYGDLRLLGSTHSKGWAWDTGPPSLVSDRPKPLEEEKKAIQSGHAPIERLPPELLGKIPCFPAAYE